MKKGAVKKVPQQGHGDLLYLPEAGGTGEAEGRGVVVFAGCSASGGMETENEHANQTLKIVCV